MRGTIIFLSVAFFIVYTLSEYLKRKERETSILRKLEGGLELPKEEQEIYDRYTAHFKALGEVRQQIIQDAFEKCLRNREFHANMFQTISSAAHIAGTIIIGVYAPPLALVLGPVGATGWAYGTQAIRSYPCKDMVE